MKHQLGTLAREDEAITERSSTVDLIGEVDSLKRSGNVGDNTRHAEVKSLLGNIAEAEGILDHFLQSRRHS